MVGKIEGRRRRGPQGIRWLDGITDLMDMSLSELQKLVMGIPAIEAWSLNHCTTREVPRIFLDYDVYAKASTGKSKQHAETDG